MASRKSSTIALLALCLIGWSGARADETVPSATQTPPLVAPATPETTTPAAATPVTAVDPLPVATPLAKSALPSDPTALLYADTVAPGPYEAKRKLLLASIKMAKKQGFGITVYLNELNKVEDQIKQGNSGPQLEARVDSIADGLQDQLKRSQILKTQRPAGSSSSHSYTQVSTDSAGGRPRRSTDAIINELRQKYGDKIPGGLGGLDGDLKEKLMKSDVAKEYLKKMQQ